MTNLLFKKAFEAIPEEDKKEIMTQIREVHELPEDTDITDTAYIYVMEDMLLNVVDAVLGTASRLDSISDDADMPEAFMEKENIKPEDKEVFFKGFDFAKFVVHQSLLTEDTMASVMAILQEHIPTEDLIIEEEETIQ